MSETTTDPDGFADYLQAAEDGTVPLLGHLVLYSVYDSEVTHDQMEGWFTELGLNPKYLPTAPRASDAFERITGPSGARTTYALDGAPERRRRRRKDDPPRREATLMMRHVTRDPTRIVRHLVREVRDEQQTKLIYKAKLGEACFDRDLQPSSAAGAGTLTVTPDTMAIAQLPEAEQERVHELLEELRAGYTHRCTFLTGDKIRAAVRGYIEDLKAIKVSPSGGVYFVHNRHAATLGKLRELVSRCGEGSHLMRVPLPDTDEQRETVVAAWRSKAAEDLKRLARDIAAATEDAATDGTPLTTKTIQDLHQRFTELQATTTEHEQLLEAAIGDTQGSFQMVQLQLASLLTKATN